MKTRNGIPVGITANIVLTRVLFRRHWLRLTSVRARQRCLASRLRLCALGLALLATATQAANVFTPTGNLGTSRFHHTATLLPNGKVLIAGGFTPGSHLSELFDPATGTWTNTTALTTARYDHTATLLPNAAVLAIAGQGGGGVIGSAELYDVGFGFAPPRNPISLTGPKRLVNGAFQFRFINVSGLPFSVFAATNAASPPGNWTPVGTPIGTAVGQYQFTDPQATNYPQHYYRVQGP